jgi:hypothetical protein
LAIGERAHVLIGTAPKDMQSWVALDPSNGTAEKLSGKRSLTASDWLDIGADAMVELTRLTVRKTAENTKGNVPEILASMLTDAKDIGKRIHAATMRIIRDGEDVTLTRCVERIKVLVATEATMDAYAEIVGNAVVASIITEQRAAGRS